MAAVGRADAAARHATSSARRAHGRDDRDGEHDPKRTGWSSNRSSAIDASG